MIHRWCAQSRIIILREADDSASPKGCPIPLIPIDHFLLSPDVKVVSREVGPEVGSDHRPVTIDVDIEGN